MMRTKREFKPSLVGLEKRDALGAISGASSGPAYLFANGSALAFNNPTGNMWANGIYLGQGTVSGSIHAGQDGLVQGGASLSFGRYQISINLQQIHPGDGTLLYQVVGDDVGIPVGTLGYLVFYNYGTHDTITFK
jgi:hypothetical protein